MTKQQINMHDKITDAYMDHVLEKEEHPKSVYKFCKEIKIEEAQFYEHFGKMDDVKKRIWSRMLNNAIGVLHSSEEYKSFGTKEKIIAFYFSVFEVFRANRSYILATIDESKTDWRQLCQFNELRSGVIAFFATFTEEREIPIPQLKKFAAKTAEESAWMHFLFVLRFWVNDSSPGFEKTDVLIEKSVNTTYDLLGSPVWEGMFDLGKFLWKERMMAR